MADMTLSEKISPPSPSRDIHMPSRNVSFSRLNAQAPAFVPRASSRPDLHNQIQILATPQPSARVFRPPATSFSVPTLAIDGHYQHHRPQYFGVYGGPDAFLSTATTTELNHATAFPEESSEKILNQVEYYFSDLNLATTDHLMRFISKDSDGCVPLSVVASFNKIKALTTSHSHLAAVLRKSSKLVVSEDGKKVGRRVVLSPTDMEELQARIVIADNLPEDHCHQNLMKIFSAVGSVKNIRTCQPYIGSGGGAPAIRADNVVFSNKLHAFVEYESRELAKKAVEELNNEGGSWRSSLRLRSLQGWMMGRIRVNRRCESDGNTAENASVSEKQQQQEQRQCEDSGAGEEAALMGKESKGQNYGRGRGYCHLKNDTTIISDEWRQLQHPKQPPPPPPGPRMPDGTRGFGSGRGKPIAVNT